MRPSIVRPSPSIPAYADAKANLGVALRDAGDTEVEALALSRAKRCRDHPGHTVLLNAYGNTLRQAGGLDEAIDVLHRAVEQAPHPCRSPQQSRAWPMRCMGKLEEAAAISEARGRAQARSAGDQQQLRRAGVAACSEFDEAVAALSNAVAEKPDYDEALINLGVAHYMRGDADDAIAAYRRVLARNPDNGFARYSLGVSCSKISALRKRKSKSARALALDPKNAMAQNTLGVLLLDQHSITAARTAMREAADVEYRCRRRCSTATTPSPASMPRASPTKKSSRSTRNSAAGSPPPSPIRPSPTAMSATPTAA